MQLQLETHPRLLKVFQPKMCLTQFTRPKKSCSILSHLLQIIKLPSWRHVVMGSSLFGSCCTVLKGRCCDRLNRACCRPVAHHGAKSGACFLHAGMQLLELKKKIFFWGGGWFAYHIGPPMGCALFRAYYLWAGSIDNGNSILSLLSVLQVSF